MESTGCTGFRCSRFWRSAASRCAWSTPSTSKMFQGRRTDVCDCQWLQLLHSVGLLKASYRPAQEVCAVRSLLRHRESLVQMAATHVNHMQKALDQMNVPLHHMSSDIVGQTGLAIVDAILAGQRDPLELAKLRGVGSDSSIAKDSSSAGHPGGRVKTAGRSCVALSRKTRLTASRTCGNSSWPRSSISRMSSTSRALPAEKGPVQA
jgi:hypothetical protein